MCRNTTKTGLAAVLLFLVFSSQAAAAGRVLTLAEALNLAMEENHGLRAFRAYLSAQHREVGIAKSIFFPKLRFEERFMRTNNPTFSFMAKLNQERFTQEDFAIDSLNQPEAVNDFQTAFSFEQVVFAPRAAIGIDMARKEHDAIKRELERKKENIAREVFKAYLTVQTAQAFTEAAEKGTDEAKEHLRIARARYDAELGLYSDVLRAQVSVSSADERVVTAKKNLDVAKRGLGLLIGLAESVEVTQERPMLEVKDIQYYQDVAAERHDIKSLESRSRNAENVLRMANAGYLPVIGFGGLYQLNDHRTPFGGEGDSWQMAAFLRWDIFDGMKREHEKAQARERITETAEYLKGLKKEISFRVYGAYLGVEEAKKGLELANASLAAAEEGRRLVKVRYENALSTMVDLLDVQASLDSVRAHVIEREGAYLISIADLMFESGVILEELGLGK